MAPDKIRERSAGRIEPSQEIILKIISQNSRNFPKETPQSCLWSKKNNSSLFLSEEKISLYLVNFIPPRSEGPERDFLPFRMTIVLTICWASVRQQTPNGMAFGSGCRLQRRPSQLATPPTERDSVWVAVAEQAPNRGHSLPLLFGAELWISWLRPKRAGQPRQTGWHTVKW